MQRDEEKHTPTEEANREFIRFFIIGILSAMLTSFLDAQSPPRADTGNAAARAVIARHDSASGRIGGVSRVRYWHTISVTEAATGKTVMETWLMAPNRVLTKTTMDTVTMMEMGYNGTVGWMTTPVTGAVLLEGEQLKAFTKLAEGRSQFERQFKTLSAGPRTVVEGKAVVPVKFDVADGIGGTLYFDVATGLLHAMSHQAGAPGSEFTIWTFSTDYKRFGGELIALTSTMKGQGQHMVTRTTHVDNKPIDTAHFTPPAAVKALVKRP
jgi:hypothetical protein